MQRHRQDLENGEPVASASTVVEYKEELVESEVNSSLSVL